MSDGELGDFESKLEALDEEREDEDVDDLPPVDTGDHVSVRDDEDGPTLVVLETPLDKTASTYKVDGLPLTEFDSNAGVPVDDDVVVCKFCRRTDVKLTEGDRYAYPRSRLEVEARVHDRDEEDSE